MNKIIILFFLVSVSLQTDAKPYVARVAFIKGKATQLSPHKRNAVRIKRGDRLREDSSILTYDRSVLKIKFFDNSTTTLGPNSKLIIKKSDPKKGSILGLLTGKIRTSLKKDKKKLFIKTRSAALGVRGTDFQTIYNPAINNTSIITFQGNVAMAKIPQKRRIRHKLKMVTDTSASWNSDQITLKQAATNKFDEFSEFDKLLEKEGAVEVKPGRFASAVNNLKRATVPVKINPTQFSLLKKNKNLLEAKKTEEIINVADTAKSVPEKKVDGTVEAVVADDPPPEGFFDEKTEKFAPRAGGYIDSNTGIYIPPEKTAKFDEVNKVYIPSEDIGGITSTTGNYAAPEGLELDATKGFVVKKDDIPQIDKNNLLSMQNNLNKKISPVIGINNGDRESAINEIKEQVELTEGGKYRIGETHASAGIMPTTERLTCSGKFQEKKLRNKDITDILVNINRRTNKTWGFGAEFQTGKREFRKDLEISTNQKNTRSTMLFAYALYFYKPTIFIKAGPGVIDQPYARINVTYGPNNTSSVSSIDIYNETTQFAELKFGKIFFDQSTLFLTGELGGLFHFGKATPRLEIQNGYEFNGRLDLSWRFGKNISISEMIYIGIEKRTIENRFPPMEKYETSRFKLGAGLTVSYDM